MISEKIKNEILMKCQPKNLFSFTVPRRLYSYPLHGDTNNDVLFGPAFRGDIFMSLFSYYQDDYTRKTVILHPQFGVCCVYSDKRLGDLSWSSML
jgi:hypothetical protein